MSEPNRAGPCPCGSGKKYKSCCLAKDRARLDLRAAVTEGHDAIDRVLAILLPLVESRGEHKIACTLGCNNCCHTFIRATYAEGEAIADFLAAPEHSAARARFTAKLPTWREAAGEAPAQLDALLASASGPAGSPEWNTYREASDAYVARMNLCPFNHEQKCDIYPVRPTPCRTTYVTSDPAYCLPNNGGKAAAVTAPQLYEAIASASERMRKAAAKSGADAERHALPELVASALERRR